MADTPPSHWPWPPVTEPAEELNNPTLTDCHYWNHIDHLLFITVMVTAVSLLVLFNILHQRHGNCHSLPWGLPGVVIPVNLLHPTPFRLVYCLVLSCLGADVLQNLFDKALYFRSDDGLSDAFLFFIGSPAVIILIQSLAYFPVFACVDSTMPVLGHLLGFLFTGLLSGSSILKEFVMVRGCSYRGHLSTREVGISLGTVAPVYLLQAVLVCWFFCHAIRDATSWLLARHSILFHITRCSENEHHLNHVRSLLRRPVVIGRLQMRFDSLWNFLQRGFRFVLPYSRDFHYPLPFLGALCMAVVMVYQLVFSWTAHLLIAAYNFGDFIQSFDVTVTALERLFPNSTCHTLRFLYNDLVTLALAYQVILPVSSFIALGIWVFFVLYMVQTFHKKLRLALRGNYSFLLDSEPLPSLAYRLAAMMRYSAFQVAYLVISWILFLIMMTALLTIGLVFFYLFKDREKFGIHLWAWFMVPMMWASLMHHLELFLCRYVFLRNGGDHFAALRFRRLYQVLTYFLFFFNAIFGCVMCVLRLVGVLIFTCVMAFRIDHDVYMRGLEGWDTGYRTFVGYICMEFMYNNPVLRTFVQLLWDAVEGGGRGGGGRGRGRGRGSTAFAHQSLNGTLDSKGKERLPSLRARNRWHLAYTLLHNPSLLPLRGGRWRHEAQYDTLNTFTSSGSNSFLSSTE